jgi:hypothetical protein
MSINGPVPEETKFTHWRMGGEGCHSSSKEGYTLVHSQILKKSIAVYIITSSRHIKMRRFQREKKKSQRDDRQTNLYKGTSSIIPTAPSLPTVKITSPSVFVANPASQ